MASVPQQMQQNMVFATAPQMTTTAQGPLLIAPGQAMGQPMNGQMPQYIQTGYPAGFVTQGPNQYISMGSYPVMVNGFQPQNQVQNLAIQIPQNNAQQMIATTPTQMQPQNVGQKSCPKGQQMQGNQQGMMKAPVTANKSIHPQQQMQQAQQNGQQQMLQQGTYFVASNGQAYHAVPAQQTPPQPQQQQNQNQNNKKNNNVKGQKQTPQPPKPIQIQTPMMQQAYKPNQGMSAGNMQQAQAIQFANNGQPIMFSPMQPAQTIWSPQPVQQGQFAVATQPQQVVLRSPGGDQTAMVLQQPGQSQYQMPVQIQGQQQQQPGTPTMQMPQQPVIQLSNGTYTQVATATTPTTPTKSVMIQPKIQQNQEITPKAGSKIPVKLVPNNASLKTENTPAKLAPKIVPTPTTTASGTNVSQKSIGTHAPRSSFPSISSHQPTNQSKQNVRSVQTATNTPITRTVNTQVNKKIPDKRSQGTGSPALQNIKKEDVKPKNEIIQHIVDGMVVLESKQPFPCEQDSDVQNNNINNNNIKVKDLKGEQKENITTQIVPKGKPQNVPEMNGKNDKKLPDPKVKPLQNGIKFQPITSKPSPQNIPPPPAPKVSTSKSVSTGTGTPSIAGNKRPAPKSEYKNPEKKPAIQTPIPAPAPVNTVPVAVQLPVAPVPNPAPVPKPPTPEARDAQTNGNNYDSNDNNAPNVWLPANNTNPKSWTVDDVCEFIAHIDGCAQYADEFRTEEIDGQALMLIKEKHLVQILNTKWGMALKIYRKIEELKTAFHISG